jgi:hypothetical protein
VTSPDNSRHIRARVFIRDNVGVPLLGEGRTALWPGVEKWRGKTKGKSVARYTFRAFLPTREESMKFSFVRSLWNHLRFHVRAGKKHKPPSERRFLVFRLPTKPPKEVY